MVYFNDAFSSDCHPSYHAAAGSPDCNPEAMRVMFSNPNGGQLFPPDVLPFVMRIAILTARKMALASADE